MNTIKAKTRKRDKDEALHVKRYKLGNSESNAQPCVEDTAQLAHRWLKINNDPWTTVLDMWKACFQIREQFLTKPNAVIDLEKIELWRFISLENGYQLVN